LKKCIATIQFIVLMNIHMKARNKVVRDSIRNPKRNAGKHKDKREDILKQLSQLEEEMVLIKSRVKQFEELYSESTEHK